MTPLGLVTMASLAHQGAHIIALVPDLNAPEVVQLLLLLRESTKNESIYAESCDMGSLQSITEFANRWNAGSAQATTAPGAAAGMPSAKAPGAKAAGVDPAAADAAESLLHRNTPQVHRLDTVLFLPVDEGAYKIGVPKQPSTNACKGSDSHIERTYMYEVLGRFHLVNALLPSLLLMPPNRDVRIVSVVSPWYAAGLAEFDTVAQPIQGTQARVFQPWTLLGAASLRWIVLASELQRRLDLLSEADTRPRTKLPGLDVEDVTTVPVGSLKGTKQRSHISSVMVCPGFERSSQLTTFFGTVRPFLEHRVHSLVLWVLLALLYPLFWLFGKSASKGADAAVWGVTARMASAFYPTAPQAAGDILSPHDKHEPMQQWPGVEPGRLYREGKIVIPPVPAQLRGAKDATELWNATEAQVEAVLGGIARPGQS